MHCVKVTETGPEREGLPEQFRSHVTAHAKQYALSVYKYFYVHVVKFVAKNLSQPRAAGNLFMFFST